MILVLVLALLVLGLLLVYSSSFALGILAFDNANYFVMRQGVWAVVGIAAMLAFHIFVNIGMTVRIMPVTGLPLPFMSAGGTVFIALSASLGLAHSAWIRRNSPVGE